MLVVSVLCLVLGIGTASVVVRTDLPFRKLFTVLFAMPLAVPGFVSSYAVYSLGLLVAPQSNALSSFAGASIILALTLYPYIFLPCVVALANLDAGQEEVARSLRGGVVAVFRHVVIPHLRPALAGGVLIVALHVLAEYGAMVQLGQHTLTTTIMGEMLDYGNYRSARSLSLVLAVISVAVLLANRAFAGSNFPTGAGSHTARPTTPKSLGGCRPLVAVVVVLVPLAALGPTVLMTARGLALSTRGTSTTWPAVFHATGNTLGYAAGAALVGTVAALPVSWWVARRPSTASNLTERSVWVAHAIPNAILALAMVFLATRLVPGLYKTGFLLVIAYVLLFLPLAVSNQRVGLRAALVGYEDVAASLGSRSWNRFYRISLPLALPGVATGALLVGLDASKELTTTLMLLPFNTQTLATGLWATTNGQSLNFSSAAPYALMLGVLGSIPVFMIVRRTLRFIR